MTVHRGRPGQQIGLSDLYGLFVSNVDPLVCRFCAQLQIEGFAEAGQMEAALHAVDRGRLQSGRCGVLAGGFVGAVSDRARCRREARGIEPGSDQSRAACIAAGSRVVTG
jgi:hypothetical protein